MRQNCNNCYSFSILLKLREGPVFSLLMENGSLSVRVFAD